MAIKKKALLNEFSNESETTTTAVDIEDELFAEPSSYPTCSNLFPRLNSQLRIAIIGDSPSESDTYYQLPFSPSPIPSNPKAGSVGRLLNDKLSSAGIIRDTCFLGNVCQHFTPGNNVSINSAESTKGLEQLTKDLASFNPNICILLGRTPLLAAKGVTDLDNWRGSLFIGTVPGPFLGRKCLATYHPLACFRQYENTPLLWFDLKKASSEASSPTLELPQRDLRAVLTYDELINELDTVLITKPRLACDIEGYWNNLKCISFATSPTKAFCVPFTHLNGSSYWSEEEEYQIWYRFVRIMADSEIKKCWQNGLYDRFVLQYGYNVVVFGNQDDTMLKFWEMWCELDKSLAFQNSILNKEPFYKAERKSQDERTFFEYCCKDSCTTFENNDRLERLLSPAQKEHYRFNHTLLNPLLYMELRGIRYDTALAKKRLIEVNSHITKLQSELDSLAGFGWKEPKLSDVQSILCYKKDPSHPKKGNEVYYQIANIFSANRSLTPEEITFINQSCDQSLNIKSAQFKTFLYETLHLPPQYKEDPKTKKKSLTTDYEALLRLSKLTSHPSIPIAIQIGLLRTRAQMLEISADEDGRIRCGYNIVGTETGRLTCYTSPTGSGYNLQTIPDANHLKPEGHPLHTGMRDIVCADEDCDLAQCDLSGADGWTVGALLAALGDPTMLDDLRARLKPAQIICYLLRHGNFSLSGKTREELKPLLKEVKKEDWDYFFSKQGIWGTCYTMGPKTIIKRAFIESEGLIDLTEKQGIAFQAAVKARYHIPLLHSHTQRQIRIKPELTAPNGFKRRFFGRWNEILGQYLAHLPQVLTTYATNTALYRLWTDPDNRILHDNGSHLLRVEPLHQVHDALLAQWKISNRTWAVDKIKSWFNNEINVAGTKLIIPFEGSYGRNWALDSDSKVGEIK